jgi:phage-related protein
MQQSLRPAPVSGAGAIYVMHASQKRSQRTARLDIELARSRFNSLM